MLFSLNPGKAKEYLGSPNVLECTSSRSLGHDVAEADCLGLPVVVPSNGKQIWRILILPHDVGISTNRPTSEVNVSTGKIRETKHVAGTFIARVDVNGHVIAAELPKTPFASQWLLRGSNVFAELSFIKLRVGS